MNANLQKKKMIDTSNFNVCEQTMRKRTNENLIPEEIFRLNYRTI